MDYKVKLTESAAKQTNNIILYISNTLMSPESAKNWSQKLRKAISGLNLMPHRHPLLEREPWKTKGVRRMTVGNFNIYYYTDEENKTVWVISVIYGRRDQLSALKNID